MKNLFKAFFVVAVSFLCVFIYNSFMTPNIVGIKKGTSDGLYDSYVITYSNGTTDTITIKNGEDANDITIEDLYIATKTALGKGDDYTMIDFINDYLTFTVQEKDETKAYLGALSTVEVYSEFPTSLDYISHKKGNSMAAGAGVIYQPESADANEYYIITNYHVISDSSSLTSDNLASKVTCFLYGSNVEIYETALSFGGSEFTYGEDALNCTLVGGSMNYDIAVLKVTNGEKITNSNARPIKFFENDVVVGESVIAVGNPGGMGGSVTKGIVSLDRELRTAIASDGETEITFSAIRIDAPINSGNSGGGLYNSDGELVGLVNSKIVDESVEGMAHALPAIMVKRATDKIIASATDSFVWPKKADLGIELDIASSKAIYDSDTLSIKIVQEVEVAKISQLSVCKDKLIVGDIITGVKINAVPYALDRDFRLDDLTWIMEQGSVIIFDVLRSGSASTIEVPVVVSSDCFKIVN